MWIFGYGSLMSDGWEGGYGCSERLWADLAGYRRAFNKKSVENWGTALAPGLTLNLAPNENGSCRGVAFCFGEAQNTQAMLAALRKREACEATELPVQLEDGRIVTALIYIYTGKNLLEGAVSVAEKAAMVLRAEGKSGANWDYVQKTFEDLRKTGVSDPTVTELWQAVMHAREVGN